MRTFLSYSHKDHRVVTALLERLPAPLQVWVDRTNLSPGKRIQAEIDEAVASCDLFVVLLTEASASSTWVKHEIELAVRHANRGPRPHILPIAIDLSDSAIPSVLMDRLAVRIGGDGLLMDGLHRVVRAICDCTVDMFCANDPVAALGDRELRQLCVDVVTRAADKKAAGYLVVSALQRARSTFRGVYAATVWEDPSMALLAPWVLDCARTTAMHLQRSRLDLLDSAPRHQRLLEQCFILGYLCTSLSSRRLCLREEFSHAITTLDLIPLAHRLDVELQEGARPEGWDVEAEVGASLVNRLLVPGDMTEKQASILVYSAYNGAIYAYAEEIALADLER